jgi:hypothetical protein
MLLLPLCTLQEASLTPPLMKPEQGTLLTSTDTADPITPALIICLFPHLPVPGRSPSPEPTMMLSNRSKRTLHLQLSVCLNVQEQHRPTCAQDARSVWCGEGVHMPRHRFLSWLEIICEYKLYLPW